MKVTVITLANKRPDFIELQYNSFKKHLLDEGWEYIVFNNAADDHSRSRDIEAVCATLGVQCIRLEEKKQRGDVSQIVAKSLQQVWKYILGVKDLVILIDSDMFFVKDISIIKMMEGRDMAFIPNYRKKDFGIIYPWTGLLFFNMNTMPEPETFSFGLGTVEGEKVDVGGLSYYYLKKNEARLRVLYLEILGLQDVLYLPNGEKTLQCGLNVNTGFSIRLSSQNEVIDITHSNFLFSKTRSFPHEKEREEYNVYLAKTFLSFEHYLRDRAIDLPHPYWVDLLKVADTEFNESFIFHYKSGSNWLPFYTDAYNQKKTAALRKFLGAPAAVLKTYGDKKISRLFWRIKEETRHALRPTYQKLRSLFNF